MESIALKSSSFLFSTRNSRLSPNLSNGRYPCFLPFSSQKLSTSLGSSVIVAAKKNPNYDKKPDTHSFVSRPDESTGLYPEAVLLKKKTVQEDGKVLPEFADDEEKELYQTLNLELESDLAVDQMRHYEVVYMIHEDKVDEVESVNLKIQDYLKEKKGKIWRFSDWGIRRLAYRIKKADFAHYILMNFELEAKWINEFKNMLDKDERVIRHLVIKMDKAVTEDCPPPPEFHTIRGGEDYEDSDDEDEDDEDEDDEDDDEEYEDDDEEYEDGDDEEYEDGDEEEYEDDDDEEEEEEDDDAEDRDEEQSLDEQEDDDGDEEEEGTGKKDKVLVASGRRKSKAE